MPVSPEVMAAIDTAITMGFSSATLLVGYVGGKKDRREQEKIEKRNAEIETKNDRRSLKN